MKIPNRGIHLLAGGPKGLRAAEEFRMNSPTARARAPPHYRRATNRFGQPANGRNDRLDGESTRHSTAGPNLPLNRTAKGQGGRRRSLPIGAHLLTSRSATFRVRFATIPQTRAPGSSDIDADVHGPGAVRPCREMPVAASFGAS